MFVVANLFLYNLNKSQAYIQ